jgi:LDH2 family malate/lactate/ureidoglycolate dehydrogenase
VSAMAPLDVFKIRVDAVIREIRAAPKAKGADRIYVPGEMEWQKRRDALERGIALPDDVMASLRGLAHDLTIETPWLSA